MSYNWKTFEELAWIAVVAGGIAVLQVLAGLDPNGISDWRTWFVALAGGALRAAAGAAIAFLTKPR